MRYSLAFADGVGQAMTPAHAQIQALVDEGASIGDDNWSQADDDRLRKNTNYYALGLQAVHGVLETGLLSVVEAIFQDALQAAVGLLKDAAGAVARSVTQRVGRSYSRSPSPTGATLLR